MNWKDYVIEHGIPEWPYPVCYGQEKELEAEVLVLGGGIAGCWAAISAARKGAKVVIVEKGATLKSGSGGSGCDHWLNTPHPGTSVTPEEVVEWESEMTGATPMPCRGTLQPARALKPFLKWRRWGKDPGHQRPVQGRSL